jgi:CxxC motif-containing protein
MNKKVTCIICPEGCTITGYFNSNKLILMKGYKCKRGKKFALEEIIDAKRVLTTTIRINSKKFNRLPVKSSKPVSKNRINELVREVKKLKVSPCVRRGDVLAKNLLESGADIISCWTVEK